MPERIPTQIGDVLILQTTHSFTMHVVGRVTKNGQQDYEKPEKVEYESDWARALAAAKALAVPGRRIFVRNLDTGDWSEIPH